MKSLQSLMDCSGTQILITGGAGHIGRAGAAALMELGAHVILCDLDAEALAQACAELGGERVEALVCDLSDHGSVTAAGKALAGRPLAGLINCAALVGSSELGGWATRPEHTNLDTWRLALEVNLTAAFHLIQQAIPVMQAWAADAGRSASIINISSIYGFAGCDPRLYEGSDYFTPAAYAASKGGLTQLTRYLATAVGPNIRVNTISPGGIERGQDQAFQERYCASTPLGRMGREEDLTGAIAYLASGLSEYVTGHNLVVDGGWSV